jgi:hypothetical protein
MAAQIKLISKDEEKHVFTTEEILDLPNSYLAKEFLERRTMKI